MKAPKSCRDKRKQHNPIDEERRIKEKIEVVFKEEDTTLPQKKAHYLHHKELEDNKFQIVPSCHSAAKIKHRLPRRNPRTENMATNTKNGCPQFSRTVNRRLFYRRLLRTISASCLLTPTRRIDKPAMTIGASHRLTLCKRIRNFKCRMTHFTVYNHRFHLSLPPTRKEQDTSAAK